MAIALSKENEEGIRELVRSGVYDSPDDFVRESLEHAEIRAAVSAGSAQLETGETVTREEALAHFEEKARRARGEE